MKTFYVTIPDEKLQELIGIYSKACPINEADDFSVYLSLEELKRLRDIKAEPEAMALMPKIINGGQAICPECSCDLYAWYSFCPDCGIAILKNDRQPKE